MIRLLSRSGSSGIGFSRRADSHRRVPGRVESMLRGGCRIYAACAVGLWLLMAAVGERWWPVALLLYGPRWVSLLPLAVFVPGALVYRRLLVPVTVAGVVLLGPVMGLCIPWRTWLRPASAGHPLRVLSCNVDGTGLDAEALGVYLAVTMPDLVALQEWPPESKKAVFWQQDWHIHSEAGLCIASRFPIGNVETFPTEQLGLPGGLMRCDLQTPEGTLHFVNVHLPTPRPGFEALLDGEGQGSRAIEANTRIRWQASELASRWAQERKGPVIVAGDFNMPEDCAIYRQFWSRPANGFAMAGLGWGHSKFTSHFGVRIDHVLAGSAFCFRDCQIGPDVRSDHRPVVADLVWTETSQPSGGRP